MDQSSKPQSPQLLGVANELLYQIVAWVATDKKALKNLALVNKTFHLLAREHQFADVRLNDSDKSVRLVCKLALEALERQEQGAPAEGEAIGPCIRTLRYGASERSQPQGQNGPHVTSVVDALQRTMRSNGHTSAEDLSPVEMACMELFTAFQPGTEETSQRPMLYLNSILDLAQFAMPNLTTLDLSIGYIDHTMTWTAILSAARQVKHLNLVGTFRDSRCVAVQIPRGSLAKLRSLDLKLYMMDEEAANPFDNQAFLDPVDGKAALPKLAQTVLRGCAPTLRQLSLFVDNCAERVGESIEVFARNEFPQLQDLHVEAAIEFPDILEPLLVPTIRRLGFAPGSMATSRRNGWDGRISVLGRQMPALERIDLPNILNSENAENIVEFLDRHRHIRALYIPGNFTRAAPINSHIIPFLATGTLSSLTSLALGWDLRPFPDATEPPVSAEEVAYSALAAISQLTSLRHLSLDAMLHNGRGWPVDHDTTRGNLRALQNLEELAITGDLDRPPGDHRCRSFVPDRDASSIRVEGSKMFGPLRDMVDLRARPELDLEPYLYAKIDVNQVWRAEANTNHVNPDQIVGPITDGYCRVDMEDMAKIMHRNCMLAHAERYAVDFPRLRKIYLGQWQMELTVPGSGHHGNAIPSGDGWVWGMFSDDEFHAYQVATQLGGKVAFVPQR